MIYTMMHCAYFVHAKCPPCSEEDLCWKARLIKVKYAMEKVCGSFYSLNLCWFFKNTHYWNSWPQCYTVITVITAFTVECTLPKCIVENLKIYPDSMRPQICGLVWTLLLPVAACVQREILLSMLTLFYILCPEGSDEVTKRKNARDTLSK